MVWVRLGSAFGYLGLFLFGLHFMSRNLHSAAGSGLERFLARLTGSPWKGFLAGAAVTGALQSSSLISVMVVGLVNARVMTLAQAIAVIIGANVGTTVTAQLLSFNIQHAALPLIGAAVFLYLLPLSRLKPAAGALLGWGLVLLGLGGMAESLAPLRNTPVMARLLAAAGETPWQGIGAGILTAAALQSSSGVMGLVLGMALEGSISLTAAMAVLIGADLGTCTTALIASVGMNRTARAAAWSHFIFNLLSLVLAALFFPYMLRVTAFAASSLTRRLANFHTLYNLLGALVILPLAEPLARLLQGRKEIL
ncbi:MAG: Na/Pi symporter [Bacillota bacterium]